jgi:hypothetical protein
MTKMTLSYNRVVNPVDFDEHSIQATPVAATNDLSGRGVQLLPWHSDQCSVLRP